MNRTPVRIDELVRKCAGELGILAESKNQRVVLDLPESTAQTDAVLLRQAVQNLIDNAIKYGREGGTVVVGGRALERGRVELTVRDDSHLHAGHAGAREGRHYTVRLVSECFAGLGRVARHRLVYDSLKPQMQAGIHALVIDARAPGEA